MNQTITLKIQDMHCASCAMNIDGELEDTPGVLTVSTNYAKAETHVVFDASQVDIPKLLEAIRRSGYNATTDKHAQKA